MASASIRRAAAAGFFYPDDPRVLHTQVAEMLALALPPEPGGAPKALVVPHAGYLYSGPVAASAYALLEQLRHRISRVVVIGPAHRMAVRGFALAAAQAFATPLGEVPVSRRDWQALQARPDVVVDDAPHADEHCLEVQLPFLQSVLDKFEIVPILLGDTPADAVAEVLEALWGGEETLIVISSDLSHYTPYEYARLADRATIGQILKGAPPLMREQACGAAALNGMMLLAARRGLEPQLLDLRNSGDTAGDRNSVVGYSSLAFSEPALHAGNLAH